MQNQACTQPALSTADSIAEKIASYQPSTLTAEQCEVWLPRVKELVAATPPVDLQDALQMLTAGCRFLADTDPDLSVTVDEVLTVDAIAVWATRALMSSLSRDSVRLYSAWLGRLRRVVWGATGRRPRGERPVASRLVFDRADIVDRCDALSPELAVLVVAVAGAGVEPRRATGGRFVAGSFIDADGASHRVVPQLAAVCDVFGDVIAGSWDDAARDLDAAALPASARELVAAFDVFVVTGVSPVDVFDGFGLTRHRTDRAVAVAPVRDAMSVTGVLHTDGSPRRPQTTLPVIEQQGTCAVATKVSAAQVRREMAALKKSALPMVVLSAERQRLVDGYRPQQTPIELWDRVKATHAAAMQHGADLSDSGFSQTLTIVAKLLLWRDSRQLDCSPAASFTLEAISAFCEFGLDNSPSSTKQTYRTRLMPFVSVFNPGTTPMPTFTAGGYRPNRPCYDLVEIELIMEAALHQPSRVTRRKLCAMVGFGAGGGLGASDMRPLDRSHITWENDMFVVEVPGSAPRRTVIRPAFNELIEIGLEGVGKNALVFGSKETRKNVFGNLLANAHLYDDVPKIETSRLRATWLADLMHAGVPIDVILGAAGLQSARPLIDLLPYLPARDPDTTDAMLHGGVS